MNYGGPSTEAEVGRINLDLTRSIEDQEMFCPLMVWGGSAQIRPTMSLRQCIDRIGLKNPCARHCEEIKEALAKHGKTVEQVAKEWAQYHPEEVAWAKELKESERHG